MGHESSPRVLVLHALRVHGLAGSGRISELTGLGDAQVAVELADLTAVDFVSHREGRRSGYHLTPAGREEFERVMAEELDPCRDAVQQAYESFLALNKTLLSICNDWQLREVDGVPALNDHADPNHDAAVIARLRDLDAQVQPICNDLAGSLARFERYGPTFAHALAQLEAGDLDWLTKPLMPSYHTTWFELHEDLLASLGIDRADERAG